MKTAIVIVILLAGSASATADEPSDPWKVELDVYLWGAMFGYKLKKFDLIFGYRYLDWNFDDKASLEDLKFHGPSAGVRFVF